MFRDVPHLTLLRVLRAGMFAEPEGGDDGGEGGSGGEDGAGGGGDGDGGGNGKTAADRINELVRQRNEARRAMKALEGERDQFKTRAEQLESNDQSGTVKTLQDQVAALNKRIAETDDYFDGLLETELETLSESARKAVEAIPGGARERYGWMVQNRGILTGASGDTGKPQKQGTQHERKPDGGKPGGVSSATQARIDRAKARTTEGKGWTTGL